jgi:hypothetical protein
VLHVQVLSNPEVVQLFEDKEVMAAVNEIATDPQAMHKYLENEKVQRLYRFMARHVGDRLHATAAQCKEHGHHLRQ